MTGWDAFPDHVSLPTATLAELEMLRAALPGFQVVVSSYSPRHRFEAIRRDGGPGTWCVISSDPADLWRELPCGERVVHSP